MYDDMIQQQNYLSDLKTRQFGLPFKEDLTLVISTLNSSPPAQGPPEAILKQDSTNYP